MAAEKENVNRLKALTKIPLPVDPLPALPKHLLEVKNKSQDTCVNELNQSLAENKNKQKDFNERYPLRTLNSHQILAMPGPSHRTKPVDTKPKLKIDARNVTRRSKTERLDWDYRVFKDDDNREDIVIISSDDEGNSKDKHIFFAANKQRSCLDDTIAAATPAVKNLEPNRVKNLKRSLKRPHSRELQGLSPVAKEQKKVDDKLSRKLLFNEPLQERLRSPDFLKRSYVARHIQDYATQTIMYLLKEERRPVTPNIPSITRACVLNWLMKVNGPDGNPATIQTAVWYLDTMLATGLVQVNKLQLIAAGCYWLACKLHGPGLSATRLVKCSNYAFTNENLLWAERVILQRLKFPIQPIVPQEFITYLAWRCDQSHPGKIEEAATFLYMCGIMVDKSLCNEYPSVVGCAAVRNVLLLFGKKDLMIELQLCPLFISADKKASCMSYTCSVLRRAVRTVGSIGYEYKAPYDHYGNPPSYIAQRIIKAANDLFKKKKSESDSNLDLE